MTATDTEKIAAMRQGGVALSAVLSELLTFAKPGRTLLEIEELAMKRIFDTGMKPSFPSVADYKWATCLCVNDVIVHGIPNGYALLEDDVLTIDIGLINRGWHSDTAWTKVMHANNGITDPDVETFLETGKRALNLAIAQAQPGNRVGHISRAIQDTVRGAGYGIVKQLVGHGLGKTLHEPPQIPGYLRGSAEKTPELVPGMTIAIEVIYSMGSPDIAYLEDGWSIATRDRSLSAVFEQSIAITGTGPEILTPSQKA